MHKFLLLARLASVVTQTPTKLKPQKRPQEPNHQKPDARVGCLLLSRPPPLPFMLPPPRLQESGPKPTPHARMQRVQQVEGLLVGMKSRLDALEGTLAKQLQQLPPELQLPLRRRWGGLHWAHACVCACACACVACVRRPHQPDPTSI